MSKRRAHLSAALFLCMATGTATTWSLAQVPPPPPTNTTNSASASDTANTPPSASASASASGSSAAAVPAAPKPLAETLTGGAKTDYDEGVALIGNGDFPKALVKFQSAYDQSHDARLLWNEAACNAGMHRYSAAIALMTRALSEGGNLLTPEDRAKATGFTQGLRPYVSNVMIRVNEAGANVYVDDQLLGTSPLAAATMLDLGDHKLRVTKKGFVDSATTQTITQSTDTTLDVALKRDVHEAKLAVHADQGDSISIDGHVVGIGTWEGVLPSGGHQVRVTAQGMVPFQNEILIRDNTPRTVDVTLEAEAKPTSGLPTWAWIAGGAVLAGAAAIGGYLLFKPSDTVGSPTAGSLTPGLVSLPSFRFGGR
jgi:hypothetical protein